MSNTGVLTSDYLISTSNFLLDEIENDLATYYLTAGNHMPLANISVLPTAPNNDFKYLTQDVYRNMIFGKIVTSDDVLPLIRNIPYTINSFYSKYDDNDLNLQTENYYTMVNEGTYTHVYKCLDNNNGSNSTVQPTFADISSINDELYELSDGYRWKYMYSVDASLITTFGSTQYFPVYPNTAVSVSAVAGAIDVISVDQPGVGYANWILGTFAASDLRVDGNVLLYNLSGFPNTANGFYQGCNIYISSGAGVGQYATIVAYNVTNLGNFITLDSAFAIPPAVNDTYEIYPGVIILGSGTETQNAFGRAVVNSIGNTITKVDMLQVGSGFSFATANVYTNPSVSVTTPALLRPIYSPGGGHGFDAASELGATNLGVTVQFRYTESGSIPDQNLYRQLALIKNPLFSNVVFNLTQVNGLFEGNEIVYKIFPQQVTADINIVQGSNTLTTADGNFLSNFAKNDFIYISNGSMQQLTQVWQVVNSSQLSTITQGLFTCSAAVAYLPRQVELGSIVTINMANNIVIKGMNNFSNTGDYLVGFTSGASGNVDSISRSGIFKNFDTFIGNFQYNISYVTGMFQENETVTQVDPVSGNVSSALVHSVTNNVLLITNQIGNILSGFNFQGAQYTLVGNTSGAVANVNNKYFPEVVYGSGKVLYVENVTPVTRNNQIENIQLAINY